MNDSFIYGIIGGLLAVALEACMKRYGSSYRHIALLVVPGAIVVNYCVFRMVRGSPSLPAAVVIFGTVTLITRVVISLWIGNRIGMGTWAAVGLMLAALALRTWRP